MKNYPKVVQHQNGTFVIARNAQQSCVLNHRAMTLMFHQHIHLKAGQRQTQRGIETSFVMINNIINSQLQFYCVPHFRFSELGNFS